MWTMTRAPQSEPARLFLNGKLLTLSRKRPRAGAMLVEGGRISAIGPPGEVRRSAPRGVERIDLRGQLVLPGFIDCHTHFVQMGVDSMAVDLTNARSLKEALGFIRKAAENVDEGRWVIATGWRESSWPGGRFITKRDLDECCPHNPVVAYRICGHLCSVNAAALSELCIEAGSDTIDRDSQGQITGVLRESAVAVCRKATKPDAKTKAKGLLIATKKAHGLGVTSVTDNGVGADLAAYLEAARRSELKVRVCFNVPSTSLDALRALSVSTGLGDDWLRLGGLKVFCDGALGARTAALTRPYADDPGNTGMLVHPREELDELTSGANEAGVQLAIHAIGDAGIEVALRSLVSALNSHPRKDHRHRIEHLEVPSKVHLRTMHEAGIIASMQPNFVGEWGGTEEMYVSRLGLTRTARNNPFREVIDNSVRLVFGSDCMPFSPLYGLSSAVNAPFESQRITPLEAIAAYTRDAAYASFEENVKGTLEEGKLADFAVLSADPTTDPDSLRTTTVTMTVVGGKIVYRRSVRTPT